MKDEHEQLIVLLTCRLLMSHFQAPELRPEGSSDGANG